MKITEVELLLFDLPMSKPLANPLTSGATIATVLAVVRTDDGLTGQGYGWTIGVERARFIAGAVEGAAQFALGREPLRMEAVWSQYESFSNFVGTSGLATMGMSILDIAFWDIASRAAGLPLWKMLGGHKDKAPMYMNLIEHDPSGSATTAELMAGVEEARSRGYRNFKARIGVNPPEIDVERVREFASAVGGKGRLGVDIAQRWSAGDALRACTEMDDLGLMWIEDPGHQDDVRGMRNIVERVRTPICTGENAYGLRGATRLIDEVGCAWLMLDLERCGGITGWRKAAAVAEVRNIKMTTHVYPHIGVQLVCGTAGAAIGENIPWWDDLLGGPIQVADGHASPAMSPGVGAEIAQDQWKRATWRKLVKA